MNRVCSLIVLVFSLSAASASATTPAFPSPEYLDLMKRQSESNSIGYALGTGGHGSVFGFHFNWLAVTLDSGAGLTLRPMTRFNWGRMADTEGGLFDPVWYNGAQLFWRMPLQRGLFRIYIGLSGWVGWRPSPKGDPGKCYLPHTDCDDMDKNGQFATGAFSGIEFFMPGRSYFIEAGSQNATNPNKMDGGIYLKAGSNFFTH